MFWTQGACRPLERLTGQGGCHFTAAISPVVEEDAGVLVANQPGGDIALVHDGNRFNELIGDATLIRPLDGFDRVSKFLAIAEHHRAEAALNAFPSLIAIHAVVAASDGGDAADADGARLMEYLLDVPRAAFGACVAAIHEAVDADLLDALLASHLEQREQMSELRMHAAIAAQPHQMQPAPARMMHTCQQHGVFKELAG